MAAPPLRFAHLSIFFTYWIARCTPVHSGNCNECDRRFFLYHGRLPSTQLRQSSQIYLVLFCSTFTASLLFRTYHFCPRWSLFSPRLFHYIYWNQGDFDGGMLSLIRSSARGEEWEAWDDERKHRVNEWNKCASHKLYMYPFTHSLAPSLNLSLSLSVCPVCIFHLNK